MKQTRAANPAKVAANPAKVKEYNRKQADAHYFRPFVAIDSEGRNYPSEDDIYFAEPSGRVLYERHDTYLWGAAADDGREPEWLKAQGYDLAAERPLTIYEILDWLLCLPGFFGDAAFVSFSFGYDVTQILKALPFETAWEICKRKRYHPDPTLTPASSGRLAEARPIGANAPSHTSRESGLSFTISATGNGTSTQLTRTERRCPNMIKA